MSASSDFMSDDADGQYEDDRSLPRPVPYGYPKLSQSSVKRRGKMATRTCEACRKAKVKCVSDVTTNELVSTCQRCATRGIACLWTDGETRRSRSSPVDSKPQFGPTHEPSPISPGPSVHSAPTTPSVPVSLQWRLIAREVSPAICQSLVDLFVATVRSTPGLDWCYGNPDRLALDSAYLAASQTIDAMAPEMQGLTAVVLSISARLSRATLFEDAAQIPLAPEHRQSATGEVDQLVVRHITQQAARPAISLVTCATDALIATECMRALMSALELTISVSGSDYLFAKSAIRRLSLSALDFVHSLQGRKPCELGEDVQRVMFSAWFSDAVFASLIGGNPLLSLDDMHEIFPPDLAQHLSSLPAAQRIQDDLSHAAAHGGFPIEVYYVQYVTIGAGRSCADKLLSRTARLRPFDVQAWRQHRESLQALSNWCMSYTAAFPELRENLPFVQTLVPTTSDEPLDAEAIRTVHFCWALIIGLELTIALEPLFRLYATIDESERVELTDLIVSMTPSITRDIRYVAHILHVALKQQRQIACDPIFVFLRFQINAVVQHLCVAPADQEFTEDDRVRTIETLLAGLNHAAQAWAWAQPQCTRLVAELQARRPMPLFGFHIPA